MANQLPIVSGQSRSSVQPVGREDVSFEAEYNIVGPRYFETLGIPVLRGRALRGFDDEPERVVVVNEALASLFWPGEDAGSEVHVLDEQGAVLVNSTSSRILALLRDELR